MLRGMLRLSAPWAGVVWVQGWSAGVEGWAKGEKACVPTGRMGREKGCGLREMSWGRQRGRAVGAPQGRGDRRQVWREAAWTGRMVRAVAREVRAVWGPFRSERACRDAGLDSARELLRRCGASGM